MKSKALFIGVAVGAIMWIALMGSMFVQALQAWYTDGEMAAIDQLQFTVVFGIPITILSAIAGFVVWFTLNEIAKKEGI